MINDTYLLTNIAKLAGILPKEKTILKGSEMQNVECIENAFLLVENGIIKNFGPMQELLPCTAKQIDCSNNWVMPAFIDSHTHCVFAAPRYNEFVMRIMGKTYEEIAAEGGGILNSAIKLQETDFETLYQKAYVYVQEAMRHGTGIMEIKSGYGLSTEAEIKMLRVIKKLKQTCKIPIYSTFLGAHAIPKIYQKDRATYINMIIDEMLPLIAEENLADFIDVFCDKGFYTIEETEQILTAAKRYNLRAKIHGNELGLTGGVQIAIKHKALSVDHLEHISEVEIDALKNSNTMPVILPGSSFFLKIPYSPAREMIDAGLPLAIASDFNPGSSPHYNLWFTMSLACLYNKMLPSECFNAVTINAANALGIQDDYGSITIGKKALLQKTNNFEHINEMPYWFSKNNTESLLV